MSSTVCVVSTASRGIGLEFAKQLLDTTPSSNSVVGLCRNPSKELLRLKEQFPERVEIIEVDLESPAAIEQASQTVKERFGRVDLLLNVAAILGDGKTEGEGPERALSKINPDWLQKSLSINLMGHVLMTQALFPLMIAASKNKTTGTPIDPRVVNVSARVGSISDNGLGGWYSYRMSKAALNQFTKTFSIEAKR